MVRAPANVLAVLPDVPVVEDKLNFGPYARTLLDIILNPDTQPPGHAVSTTTLAKVF